MLATRLQVGMTESTQLHTPENNHTSNHQPHHNTGSGTPTGGHYGVTSARSLLANRRGHLNIGHKMDRPPVSPTPSEQQYSLKWNDFQASILSSFRHLRDEEDFVDVTLACDQRSFTAHKVVLSACSPYFRKLLKANPCEHPIVILRDVRCDDMDSLLRYGRAND